MPRTRMCQFAFAVAALLAGTPAARADYYTVGNEFVLSNRLLNGNSYGYFSLFANDARGASNVPSLPPLPQPGQVQFDYSIRDEPVGPDYPVLNVGQLWMPTPVYGGNYKALRVDGLAFNTSLNLSAAQFVLPPGWTIKSHGNIDGFGTFSWVATSSTVGSFQNYGTFTINGLGTDALPKNFMLTSLPDPGAPPPSGMVFAAMHITGLTPTALDNFATEHWIGVATLAAPEPGTLALAILGAGAFAVVRIARRRR